MKKICVYIGSRANYSSCYSLMKSIQKRNDLKLQVILGAAGVLSKYGNLEKIIFSDGFEVDEKVFTILEGESPLTMSKSTGLGMLEVSSVLDKLKPDVLLVVGDRFDVIAPVIAATYMNIRVAHTMGGEITGTIDESIRHAITKFSHYHFPANTNAANRIIQMGEDPKSVYNVGCPRIDYVKKVLSLNRSIESIQKDLESNKGVGKQIDLSKPFLLVSHHPVTTEYGNNRKNFEFILDALAELKMPTLMLWPNADAGSDEISKAIRTYREKYNPSWLQLFINLPVNLYIEIMNLTACQIGNSSSAIREGPYIGTPAINIGTRQNARDRAENVSDVVQYDPKLILEAIKNKLKNGKFKSNQLYGDGNSGDKIAEAIALNEPLLQKVFFENES